MQKIDDDNLKLYVVWGPMLGRETEEDAKTATGLVPDDRAMHFWTESNRVADLYQETLGFTDEVESGWDTFNLYAPGTRWPSGPPPEPHHFWHVNKPLPEEKVLNAIEMAAEARKLLDGGETEGADKADEVEAAEESAALFPGFTPCDLPGVTAQAHCGTVSVPENRRASRDGSAPEGRRIDLRVAVIPSEDGAEDGAPSEAKPPIFALAGGPGQSAVSAASAFVTLFSEIRGSRDLVLVDQRGTGGSGLLLCPLTGGESPGEPSDDPHAVLGDQFPPAAIEACLERLEAEGIDPRHYTTPDAVDDLDAVREALGYDRVTLFGLSYGSRAALVYLRRHPERVASVILSGAVPTGMALPTHHAPDAQRALDLLFEACEADAACAEAYPDLEEELWAVRRRLDERPAEVEIDDPATGEALTIRLDRHLFDEEIRWRLYDQEAILIPRLVAQSHDGDYRQLTELVLRLRRALAGSQVLSVGAYLSVVCSEDDPLIDPDEARRLAEGTFLGTYRVDQQRRACALWPRGELPEGYAEPVRSDAPVLVLSGHRDPVSPPHWGEKVAAHLPNGRHVVLAGGFHVDAGTCTQELVTRFLETGSAADLDTSCAALDTAMRFVPPDEETAVD
jgi:pimeloyl-ACP methyl ester carboxylesterase